MRHITLVGLAAITLSVVTTVALAHSGVKNHAVMMRMEAMKQSKDAFKALTAMAKGERAFDPAQAVTLRAALIAQQSRVPELFQTRADDPKTEALPAIWERWGDFEAKSDAALRAMKAMDVRTGDGLKVGVTAVAVTCLDCHQTYRKKKD